MADIKGTNIAAPVVPFTTDDIYATHEAQYGKGGYRTVDLLSELNEIKEARKEEGMLVYVKEDKKIYRLDSDSTWKELKTGGSSDYIAGKNIKITDNVISALETITVNGDGYVNIDGNGIKITFKDQETLQEWSSILVDYDIILTSEGDINITTENNSINLTAGPSIDLTAESVTKNGEEIATESNLKTINGESIVGTGDIEIKGGGDVNSVNGMKGDVVIAIPSKTSELTNDSGYINDLTPIQDEIDDIQDALEEMDARIDDLQLFKFPNVTIFGEPTITNGQMSDFTANDYAQFPFLVDFRNQAFEIRMCFTTGNQVTAQENIFDSIDGLAFAVRNGHFVFAMSSDGQTWNMGEHIGSMTVLPNTTYYTKFSWNKLVYKLEVSTDKDTYVIDKQVTDTRSLFAKQIIIGKSTDNLHIFSGSINLNYCSLSIMGNEVWQGMDDAGLATRLATDLSNIDAAGVQKLNELIDTSQFPSYDYLEEYYTPLTNFNNLQEAHNTFVEATNNKIGSWTSPDYQDDTLCSAIEALDGFLVDLNTNLGVTLYGNENE